ncbi:hypothetical protein LB505_013273 [Fusarium chuoi]|nr:hypothetical protein LB505_013273 [Fusarium chuoi]
MTQLLEQFIKHIHAKQPLVDLGLLYNQISVVEEEGLGWDAPTLPAQPRVLRRRPQKTWFYLGPREHCRCAMFLPSCWVLRNNIQAARLMEMLE